mgnify:CR=1 FL=1
MKLAKKTFCYSVVLAVIMIAFVVCYFVFMLPSLYVDYMKKSNFREVVRIEEGYLESGGYEGLQIKNPAATYTLEIPNQGNEIYVTNKFVRATIKVQDEELQQWLNEFRTFGELQKDAEGETLAGEADSEKPEEENLAQEVNWEKLKEIIRDKLMNEEMLSEDYPVQIEMEKEDLTEEYAQEYVKMHTISDRLYVYEGGVSDGNNAYTTYLAVGKGENSTSITILPAMTPRMGEITSVVMESLPMIVAVVFFLVLVASGFFSGKIVRPIIRLADYAAGAREAENFDAEPFIMEEKDEIGELSRELNALYEKLRESFRELEQKNLALKEENERQEVFMRASSHQLKTPIAAALLLVDGMIQEVGKYKDSRQYLPEVKKQLLSMGKMVEDILYLNHAAENMEAEQIDLEVLLGEIVSAYHVQIEDKKLQIVMEGTGMAYKDRELLKKILDNLISNAVSYTPEGERIVIKIESDVLFVINEGVTIDEKLLPVICDPFVSSDSGQKGKGLGLYVANYYCKLTGCRLKIENEETGVRAAVFLESKGE